MGGVANGFILSDHEYAAWADLVEGASKSKQGTSTMNDWNPIETAPKDGTDILLWNQGWRSPYVGRWLDREEFEFGKSVRVSRRWLVETVAICFSGDAPTHWMRLPEVPE